MRRLLPILVITLALLPCSLAAAEEAKEFKSAGVNWTLPDGWSFTPVSGAEKGAGFFAKVECGSASVEVWAYAKNTEDLTLEERVAELKQAGGEGMGSVAASKTLDTTLSGVKGKVVVQRIDADGGAVGHFRKYVIVANGKFYQLLMRCWHDAHTTVTDDINAVRAGFRLKKGAGKKDAPESLKEVEGKAGGGGNNGGSAGDEDDDWPENGPERDGKTVRLPGKNLEWTLAEKSPFNWTGAIDNKDAESGLFLIAGARVERKKQEFEKNTPDHNFGRIDLIIQKANPGFKAINWIKSGNAKKQVHESWKLLDEVTTSKTRTKDSVKFGNHKAAYVKFEGKKDGKRMVIMMFATVLRGKLYIVRGICTGHTDTYKQMAPHVGKALSGIKFLDTNEPVRGPILGMIPDYAWHRGENKDKEKKYTGPGYIFKKPKGISFVKVRDSMNRDLRFVGEGRTDDGSAYIYFEIRTLKLNIPNTPNPDPEKLIEKRAQDWEAGAGDKAHLGSGKDGKKLKTKKGAKFGKAKGFSYKFAGHLGKAPAIEEGWVVKHKQTMLWIKMQYIGEGAEKKLSKVAKSLKKAMKFNK